MSTTTTTSNKATYSASVETHVRPKFFLRQSDPLPPPINGTLRLVFLSDTHGRHAEIPLPLPEGDILFHLGDASSKNITQMRSFVRWMKKHSFHNERIVIDGNHDMDRISKRGFMAEYEGVARVLRNEVVEVAGGKMSVAGVTWDACKSGDFREANNSIQTYDSGEKKKKVDLVLSHYPPLVEGGGRGWTGSNILSHFVKDISPPLHCFGHIHYGRGVRTFNPDITMVNCASAALMAPVVIDYCAAEQRALMIHCPLPEQLLMDHFRSSKFPQELFVG